MPNAAARVLIVDDHPDAAESMALVLSGEGFDVRTAHDGEAACAAIEAWRPCAALVDLDLPVLSGLEVARRVRGLPYGGDMLLVAITGYGRDDDRDASHAAGFDAHLVKPVEPALVLQWLTSLNAPEATAERLGRPAPTRSK